MSLPAADKRRLQLAEVLALIGSRGEFAKREIQSLCEESKPAFVTKVLKQLAAEGVLAMDLREQEERFSWASNPQGFSAEHWIEQQIVGNQVTQAPPEERPRERLLELGAAQLKTSELLAILIRSGRQGESAVQAGQKIAQRVQTALQQLPDYSPSELKHISAAVSIVAYCQIMAGIELGRRVEASCKDAGVKEKINSTEAAKSYCARHFARLAHDACHEEFHIVTLDTKLQPLKRHQITVGTLDASLVHPREVFRAAIRDAASSILLVHNHPSGDPTPSRQDREVTDRLRRSGELLGIQVIDHIIVAKEQTISLAEAG
ncbi:MAG: DNA repair protein RadC [Planctomycetales bacterium]|nr:DNA repair protein RadC [Planctomycetales bacterium]